MTKRDWRLYSIMVTVRHKNLLAEILVLQGSDDDSRDAEAVESGLSGPDSTNYQLDFFDKWLMRQEHILQELEAEGRIPKCATR